MFHKNCGNIFLGHRSAPNLLAFGLGIRQPTTNSRPKDIFLQFTENAGHLEKSSAHWIDFATATINSDGTENFKAQILQSQNKR